jgi:hypothetical protein
VLANTHTCGDIGQAHMLPPGFDVEVNEALFCRLSGVAMCEEILSHVAFNYGAQRGGQLAAWRASVERRELALKALRTSRPVGYFNESNVWTLSLRLPSGAVR